MLARRSRAAKGGSVEFRVEKRGIVHAGIGKTKLQRGRAQANLSAFVSMR